MLLAGIAEFAIVGISFVPDVVELKDGSRRVGELRASSDGVELKTPNGRVHFENVEIGSITTRADLLARERRFAESAGKESRALLSVAQWSLDHGLYAEAFDAVDRALLVAPDDADAKAFVTRLTNEALLDGVAPNEWPPASANMERERLLKRVSGRSTARSKFARELLLHGPREEVVQWLLHEIDDIDPDVRAGAADVLGGIKSDKVLARLIRASLVDANGVVRDHARAAAIASGHPQLAVPYIQVLELDDERMRERAYPALAELRDPRAVPALIKMLEPRPVAAGGSTGPTLPHAHVFFGEQRAYVRDFDVQIAQGAVIAKPIVGVLQSGVLLDVAIAGVQVISYTERSQVVDALKKITGQNLGSEALAWSRWWNDPAHQQAQPLPSKS